MSAVVQAMKTLGRATRADLERATGLHRSDVCNLLNTLERWGCATSIGKVPGATGATTGARVWTLSKIKGAPLSKGGISR